MLAMGLEGADAIHWPVCLADSPYPALASDGWGWTCGGLLYVGPAQMPELIT
jgi:hypothetical protein